jgi:hypothetical protein
MYRHWRKHCWTVFDYPLGLATRHFLGSGNSLDCDRPLGRSDAHAGTVTGRGPAIAAQMAVQSLVAFLSTLISLLEFRMGGTSLLVGALCGQLAALCVGLVALGHRHILSFPSRDWLWLVASSAPTTAPSGLMDGARGFCENALLASTTGLHALGILIHARLYHGLLLALGDTVRHNLWFKSLGEARNPESNFEITQSAWTPVQITISCLGVVFADCGTKHDKTAKPHDSASPDARPDAHTMWFGINGVLAIVVIETVAYRPLSAHASEP